MKPFDKSAVAQVRGFVSQIIQLCTVRRAIFKNQFNESAHETTRKQHLPIIVDEASVESVEIEYEGERTAAKINVIHSVNEKREKHTMRMNSNVYILFDFNSTVH